MTHWEMLQVFKAKERLIEMAVKFQQEMQAHGQASIVELENAITDLRNLTKDYEDCQ